MNQCAWIKPWTISLCIRFQLRGFTRLLRCPIGVGDLIRQPGLDVSRVMRKTSRDFPFRQPGRPSPRAPVTTGTGTQANARFARYQIRGIGRPERQATGSASRCASAPHQTHRLHAVLVPREHPDGKAAGPAPAACGVRDRLNYWIQGSTAGSAPRAPRTFQSTRHLKIRYGVADGRSPECKLLLPARRLRCRVPREPLPALAVAEATGPV